MQVESRPDKNRGVFFMRIGHGYDVHRFAEGDFITLGGVRIAHSFGLLAHSDGDVLLHALSDALLGAAALGDIGKHFPDTDPQFKGADSRALLRHVVGLIHAKAGKSATSITPSLPRRRKWPRISNRCAH